jgi:carbamate kinase
VRILVALGGNALAREGERGTWDEQAANARVIAGGLAALHAAGHDVIVTHGNGPQVGTLAVQQHGRRDVPSLPLDALVAMTQGQLGYLLQQALSDVAPGIPSVAVVTRVVVDPDDPAFAHPTKPIGAYYGEAEALQLAERNGWHVASDAGRGWRRVVPSPRPLEVLEFEGIRALAASGALVMAGGGGGVPVAREGEGLRGVEAVIDKDRTSLVLARATACEVLLMVTGVPRVALDFGTRWQRDVPWLTAAQARRHLGEGEFPPGSMGPKVEAAAAFAAEGGRAIITSGERMEAAVAGADGTWIVPDAASAPARATAAA